MEINKIYRSIDSIWKDINKKTPLIYESSYITIEGDLVKVYVNDSNILYAVQIGKENLLKAIQEEMAYIKEMQIIYINQKIERKSIENKKKTDVDRNRKRKIIDQINEKYNNIKDIEKRKIYIAYESVSKLKEYEMKKKKTNICSKCMEIFNPIEDEKVCILCRNREFNKKMMIAKSKIIDKGIINEEYAVNILGIDKKIFDLVMDGIADEKLLYIYDEIERDVRYENKEILYYRDKIEEYTRYLLRSDDKEIIKLKVDKIITRLTKSVNNIYGVNVEIK